MMVWKTLGYYAIIYIAGLQAINPELYDAAYVDGSGRWGAFRHITLPLLGPTTFFIATNLLIDSFRVFGPIFVLTQGGPADSTTVVIWEIYRYGFRYFHMGYASAMAYLIAGSVFVLILLQWRVWGREAGGHA